MISVAPDSHTDRMMLCDFLSVLEGMGFKDKEILHVSEMFICTMTRDDKEINTASHKFPAT